MVLTLSIDDKTAQVIDQAFAIVSKRRKRGSPISKADMLEQMIRSSCARVILGTENDR